MITLENASTCPADFRAAVWQEFFVSRGRGNSPKAHLGWLDNSRVTFIGLRQRSRLIAGLVVQQIVGRSGHGWAGMIGLVWVDPTMRGKGLVQELLAQTIAAARNCGLIDLILWTGKPSVYEKAGFRLCDNALFGEVKCSSRRQAGSQVIQQIRWPDPTDARCLPAFASAGTLFRMDAASAVALNTKAGLTLAGWTGEDNEVLRLLDAVLPNTWSLNALCGDQLPSLLERRGDHVALTPSRLRMIMPLNGCDPCPDDYRLRLLDRI